MDSVTYIYPTRPLEQDATQGQFFSGSNSESSFSLISCYTKVKALSPPYYLPISGEIIVEFIGLVSWVFANGPEDLSSVPGHVIPKTSKMVLDTSLLNTQYYKVSIKGKVEQSRERSGALLFTSVSKLLKREPSGCPLLRSPTLLTIIAKWNANIQTQDLNSDCYVHFLRR